MILNFVNFLFIHFHYALDDYMKKIFNKINKFSLSFLTLVFLFVFTTQQAKADSFNKKSLPIIDEVRDEISDILLNEKKYDFFKDKHKSNIEIESLSTDYDIELERASAVTQYDPILVGAGSEPYIIGSAFALNIDETSSFLKGNSGIYLIRLLSKDTAEDINLGAAISNSLADREIERISTLIPEVLESKAEIVDNRSFYY